MTRSRPWLRPATLALGGVLVVAAALLPAAARAFKAGSDFYKPASAGGGGDILFTGAPVYRRWNCTACHVRAEGRIQIHLDAVPTALVAERAYEAGASYAVTFTLAGEHRGLGSALNTNGFALTVADAQGNAAGLLTGYDPTELRQGANEGEVVSTGLFEKRTSWSFTWMAPPAGTGPVTFYAAVVDGDGMSTSDRRTSDPLHDDVAVGLIRFAER